jgi:hypothetical protein
MDSPSEFINATNYFQYAFMTIASVLNYLHSNSSPDKQKRAVTAASPYIWVATASRIQKNTVLLSSIIFAILFYLRLGLWRQSFASQNPF